MTQRMQLPAVTDDDLVRIMTRITLGFASALVAIALLGVLWIVPDPVIGTRGLIIGAALAAAAWLLPVVATRAMLAARRAGVAAAVVPGAARTLAFIGIVMTNTPALLGLVFAMFDGHDVGAIVVATPVAVASLFVNASGPIAMRRHLERLRDELH